MEMVELSGKVKFGVTHTGSFMSFAGECPSLSFSPLLTCDDDDDDNDDDDDDDDDDHDVILAILTLSLSLPLPHPSLP